MPISINGSGTITGVSVGGLPDGIVDTDMIATKAVTAPKRGAGAILQYVHDTKTDVTSFTSTTAAVIPGLSASITLSSSSNKVIVICNIMNGRTGGNQVATYRLFRDSTDLYTGAGDARAGHFVSYAGSSVETMETVSYIHEDSPNDTSAHTYTVKVRGDNTSEIRINQYHGGSYTYQSSITLLEVAV